STRNPLRASRRSRSGYAAPPESVARVRQRPVAVERLDDRSKSSRAHEGMSAIGPRPVSRGDSLRTTRLAQPEFGPDGANDSKDPQEGHDLIVVELARVDEIGRLDEGVIRERADHDARRPEHAEDPQGYPPCLHKMENENANEGGRAHRNDGFEDRNWHRGLRCSVTLSAFRINPPQTNQIGTSSTRRPRPPEQNRRQTTPRPSRFYLVRRRQGSLSPRERTY